MKTLLKTSLSSLLAAALLLGATTARADDCCRVVVSGCGKGQMKICLPGDCNSAAETRAREMYEKVNSCSSATVHGYVHTCESDKCDIDLRSK